jgi:hypothetical protein
MRILLVVLAVLTCVLGVGLLISFKGGARDIQAFILFLITAVLINGAATVESINQLRKDLQQRK